MDRYFTFHSILYNEVGEIIKEHTYFYQATGETYNIDAMKSHIIALENQPDIKIIIENISEISKDRFDELKRREGK